MKELFLSILNASLYGSIVIAAVLILRLVLKKAPRALFCLLWLLAGLRLMLPFEIESRFSLQPDMQQIVLQQEEVPQNALPSDQQTQELPPATQVPAVPGDIQLPEDVVIEYNDNAVTDHQQVVIDYVAIAAWVWAAGTAALGIYSIASYRKLKKQVAEAVRMEDGYWESARIDTAFVLGFFRPRIYLPVGLTEQDRGLILAHEHGHIARGDHWYKPVGYCVLAIYWFNPLVWLAYLCLCRDIEMACDERVVRGMDVQARKDYSRALLNCAGSHGGLTACPVAFGETSVKQRIVSVLNYRKPGFWVMVAAVVALAFVAVCLMTSPVKKQPEVPDIHDGANWGITFSAENVTPRGMTLVCEQDGTPIPGMLMTGAYFRLETWTEDGWRELPTIQDAIFTTEGWVITNGQTQRWDVNWAWLYGQLEPGRYRIFKIITLDETWGSETDWNGGVEFTVTEQNSEAAQLKNCWEIYRTLCDSENYYVRINGEYDFVLSDGGNRYYEDGGRYSGLLYEGEFYVNISDSYAKESGLKDAMAPGWNKGTLLGYLGETEVHAARWIEQLWENNSWEDLELSYRGSEDRDGGKAFLFDRKSTGAAWEFVFDANGQFLYFMEGQTKVEIIVLEAEPIEAKLKALYEEAAGLGGGEHLARCREALTSFQAQNTYSLMIERQMSGDILNDNATQLFYVSGEDWLRHCVINEVDYIEEDWYLNKNGRQFTKCTTHHNHDGNGVDINTGWVEGPMEENMIYQPWLRTFDLDAQPVEFIGHETDGNLETITVRVAGKPSEVDPTMEVAEYTVDFVFHRDSRTLRRVVLRYTQTWPMVSNGEDTTGVDYMVATMTPNPAGEDMVLQMLEAMYTQAITN